MKLFKMGYHTKIIINRLIILSQRLSSNNSMFYFYPKDYFYFRKSLVFNQDADYIENSENINQCMPHCLDAKIVKEI